MLQRAAILMVGALSLLGLVLVGLVVWGLHEMERVEAAQAEARSFSANADEASCLSEATDRLESCGGFRCETEQIHFLLECLRLSHPAPGFCKGVPSPNAETELLAWAKFRCKSVKATEGLCAALFYLVQEHCNDHHRAH